MYVHGYSSLMREGSPVFATASPRGINRPRFLSLFRHHVCRPFLFLKLPTEMSSVMYPKMWHSSSCKTDMFYIFPAQVKAQNRVAWMRDTTCVFYVVLLRVARACIITPHLHREAEGLNGVRAADVWFLSYFFYLPNVLCASVYYYYKNINMRSQKPDCPKIGWFRICQEFCDTRAIITWVFE